MNREQLLKQANIPESWWADCYISEDGMIFTPRYDGEEMESTGEQAYEAWLIAKEQPEQPEPALPDGPPMQGESVEQRLTDLEAHALDLDYRQTLAAAGMSDLEGGETV